MVLMVMLMVAAVREHCNRQATVKTVMVGAAMKKNRVIVVMVASVKYDGVSEDGIDGGREGGDDRLLVAALGMGGFVQMVIMVSAMKGEVTVILAVVMVREERRQRRLW